METGIDGPRGLTAARCRHQAAVIAAPANRPAPANKITRARVVRATTAGSRNATTRRAPPPMATPACGQSAASVGNGRRFRPLTMTASRVPSATGCFRHAAWVAASHGFIG